MATDAKEKVLAIITRKAPCPSTPILQNFPQVRAAELHQITRELAGEGKIRIWNNGRKTIYALPGSPDPFAGEEKKAPVEKKQSATPPSKTRAKKERAMPSPRKPGGNGVYAATIAELEARRSAALDTVEKIDAALATLRALA